MKIFHTSDLHLVKENDKRWEALVDVLSHARQNSIGVLVISGDLFNSNIDAETLRVPLRSLFEEVEFETLIIPGNHDAQSYGAGLLFGKGVRLLNNTDWSRNIVDQKDVRFIGIPYAEMDTQELRRRLRGLKDIIDPDQQNILIYHGELLDVSFDRNSFGAETGRYMPSRLAFFEELGVDYVLAGHFHTSFNPRKFGDNGYFIYPGSPVSITRREIGKRHAALIEPGEEPIPIPLDTHHFERVEVSLDAFSNEDPLEIVKARLQAVDPAASALLSISGTIQGSEEDLAEAIKAEIRDLAVEEREFTFRDLRGIIGHPVYALFQEHLECLQEAEDNSVSEGDALRLREMVIQAMSEVGL